MGRRAHSAAVAATPPDRVRPPGGPGQRPREHAGGLRAGRAAGRDGPGERRVAHPGRRGGARPRRRGAPGPPEAPDRRRATGPTCRPTSPRSRTSTPRWAPTSSICLDVKDPAAFDRTVEVARAAGGEALERLWLCHHDWEQVAGVAGGVSRGAPGRLDLPRAHAGRARAAGRRARRGRDRRGEPPPLRVDRRA